MFPVAAEAHAMTPRGPVDIVRPLKGARVAILRDINAVSGDQTAKKSDSDAVQAEAICRISRDAFALLLGRRRQVISEVRVGEPEIVHQGRLEHTGDTHLSLVREIVRSDPIGLQSITTGDTVVRVCAKSQEGGVFLV